MWYFFLKIMKFTYQLKTSFSILGFTNYFVISSSALQTLLPTNICLILGLSCILNISNISFFTRLSRLNALSIYQKFVSIDNVQNVSSGFTKQSYVVKRNTERIITSKILLLKVRVYLILEVHNTYRFYLSNNE